MIRLSSPTHASISSATSFSFGVSQITLQFALDRNIDAAAQDVQAAINAAAAALPKALPYPPTYSKVNPADTPILALALSSETVPLPRIADLALNGAQQSFTIAADDQLATADAYRPIVVAYRNNAPVRLSDVAQLVDGLENEKVASSWNGKPAILINVQRQPGANIVQTVERVKRELPRLQRAVPAGVELTIVSDRTGTIRASVRDVQLTLILSVALVVAVVLLFLRTLRATIIAGVALPLSLIATFGVMRLAGYSLDNLSLMALTIGTGFVIDYAIVMIENIVRHIENGERPLEAAFRGAQEISFTVISLTLSLIAVFIPLLFMGGLVGRRSASSR